MPRIPFGQLARRYAKLVVDYAHDWFLMLLALLDSPHLWLFAILGLLVLLVIAAVIIFIEG